MAYPKRVLRACLKAAQTSPNDPRPYEGLWGLYFAQGNIDASIPWGMKALGLGTWNQGLLINLAAHYRQRQMLAEESSVLERCAAVSNFHGKHNDSCTVLLAEVRWRVLRKAGRGDNTVMSSLYRQVLALDLDWKGGSISIQEIGEQDRKALLRHPARFSRAVTTANVREIWRILQSQGIHFVAMQYPGEPISSLKEMMKGCQSVVFVDNKESFDKALARGRYSDYYVDRWKKTWGHCTARGNRLIAENAARALEPFLEKDRCGMPSDY